MAGAAQILAGALAFAIVGLFVPSCREYVLGLVRVFFGRQGL